LLDGQSVLLVMGRGKAEEKRKAYIFLTYALGAARVERVLDLKAAKAMLEEHGQESGEKHGWDWIYVDDREEAAAKAMIMGKTTSGVAGKLMSHVGRKRKRSSMLIESIGEKEIANSGRKVRIVSNEFVCQSLILGNVYEES
jgi:DNA repair protein RAD9